MWPWPRRGMALMSWHLPESITHAQCDEFFTLAYTPCLKNVPLLTCYNLDIHGLITIIFGISVTESRQSKCTLVSHLSQPVLLH